MTAQLVKSTPETGETKTAGKASQRGVGANVDPCGGVTFRVWVPDATDVQLCLVNEDKVPWQSNRLFREDSGYFAGKVNDAEPGSLYCFRCDEDPNGYPDPASRFQPLGPHGPSQVIDPNQFAWSDQDWRGVAVGSQVIYEIHIGTFTREGTWRSGAAQLPLLAELGITVLEIMPVAEFPGRFGWGYDGVNLFAPTRLYGTPDDFRAFVDCAHALGLAVILDVVYNHLGPDGNYLPFFSQYYLNTHLKTDWGAAINFDGEQSGPVREYYVANATYWIREFHLDGLRLDATQDIHDTSPEHILATISREARRAAGKRSIILLAENEPQLTKHVRPADEGGYALDGLWNDDFHHSATVLLTGRNEAYYSDYLGRAQEFVSAAKYGYLYQGQWYRWQKQPRGTRGFDLPPAAFVHFIQNHDQIANTAAGERIHRRTSPGRYKAMTALLLLSPQTPMLFQGQEFATSSPFFYFADHRTDLADKIAKGRREFMSQFPSIGTPEMQQRMPDPGDPQTFVRSKIDWSDRSEHAEIVALHRDLLQMRREDHVFAAQRLGGIDGAVLAERAFVLRFFGSGGDDRLLVVNFDPDLHLDPMPEPLLGPPSDEGWEVVWSSEEVRYGGAGIPPFETFGPWVVPGHAALVLRPKKPEA